jgi:hypothetical protein
MPVMTLLSVIISVACPTFRIAEFRTKWTTFTGFHPDTGQYQRDAQLHLENPTHRLKYLEGVDYAIENRAQTFDTLLKSTRIDKEYRRTLEEQAKANELDKKFVELVKDTQPFTRKGQLIYIGDFAKHGLTESPGYLFHNFILIDAHVPEKLRRFVIDHEIRELFLLKARYGKRAHAIARRKELAHLTKAGLTDDMLQWLRTNYPKSDWRRFAALKEP